MPKLYTYFRSSAAYRVRIALALKGVAHEAVPVHLARNGGEQHSAAYRAKNPQGLVPALELDDGTMLTQSLAIIEYLDETQPGPALLPADAEGRARVRAIAQGIACDIHPINNLRVLQYLGKELGAEMVRLGKVVSDRSDFELKYEPNSPAADASGNVKYPNVSPLIEMVDMQSAQRTYEANLNVVSSTRSMLQKTIDILRG